MRAWCGPGAGLVRAWCGPRFQVTHGLCHDQIIASAKTYVNFEGPVAGNIPHGSLRQQRSRRPVAGRPGHRRAGLKAGQQRAGAGNCALAAAAALATTDGQVAAHGSSIAALQSLLTTGLSTRQIASANNATLATVAANYGLKTVVDQRSLDIAARITPLEATLLWGPSPPQRCLRARKPRRLYLGPAGLQGGRQRADRVPCRPSTLPHRWALGLRRPSWAQSPRQP